MAAGTDGMENALRDSSNRGSGSGPKSAAKRKREMEPGAHPGVPLHHAVCFTWARVLRPESAEPQALVVGSLKSSSGALHRGTELLVRLQARRT